MTAPQKIVGIHFDQMHMGDLLRQVDDHPQADIAAFMPTAPDHWVPCPATRQRIIDTAFASAKMDRPRYCWRDHGGA